MTKDAFSNGSMIQDQFATLLTHGKIFEYEPHSVRTIAEAIQLSNQTLRNLLNGRTISPRLETARAICQLYGITLDYFGLESRAACERYLLQHRQRDFPVLTAIDEQSRQLSSDALASLMRISHWIQAKEMQGEHELS